MPNVLTTRLRPTRPRRALAAGALVLGVAGVALVVAEVIHEPGFVLWLGATLVLVLAATLWAHSTSGRRHVVALVAVAALLAVLVAGLLAWVVRDDSGVGRLSTGVVLVALAALAARHSLQPPVAVRTAEAPAPHRWPVRRPVLLVNPHSGDGAAERAGLVPACDDLGIRTIVLGPDDDLVALAEAAVADGADALGMAGGDGSLGVVAAVARAADVPFVCVPAGTRNHFALDIGLDRTDPVGALAAFTDGVERSVDVAMVNDRLFLNNVALGAYGAVVANPDYRGDKLGTTLAELPDTVLKEGAAYALELDVPGQGRWREAATVLLSNGAYELRPPRAFGRRLRLDAGQVGVVAVDVDGAASLVAITARAAFQSPDRSPHVWAWTTPDIEIGSPHPQVPAGVDGEAVMLDTPVRVRSVPGGLRLLLPPDARVGLAEQDPSVSTGVVAGLLEVVLGADDAGRD